jgi:hypothetical protein
MQLYSRGARVVNEAQPRHILDISFQFQVFGAVIVYIARRMISEVVVVWVSADPMYGVLSMR